MPTPIVFAFCKPLSSLQYSAEWSLRWLIKDWCKQISHWIGEPSESFTFVLFVPNVDSFSRQKIFLFYLCWRKINVVLFNLVYFVIWTGPLSGADPVFFLGGGALVSCSTLTPINHIFFFWQNTSCIKKPQVISGVGEGGCAPPAPSP